MNRTPVQLQVETLRWKKSIKKIIMTGKHIAQITRGSDLDYQLKIIKDYVSLLNDKGLIIGCL